MPVIFCAAPPFVPLYRTRHHVFFRPLFCAFGVALGPGYAVVGCFLLLALVGISPAMMEVSSTGLADGGHPLGRSAYKRCICRISMPYRVTNWA